MKEERLSFVIQKHETTRPHFDFRLEIDGVMPSWAIPKGPTLDNTVKRLAMKTTDHDISYQHFEGVIPEGDYGAGAVMIWDYGYYIPEREIAKGVRETISEREEGEEAMKRGVEKGEIKFQLFGKKLHGSFALVKTRGFAGKNAWLLIKHSDPFDEKGYDAKNYDISAVSNKRMSDIQHDEKKVNVKK